MTPAPTGLREAHAHIAQHGRALTMERLEACARLDDCLQRIAAAAERRGPSAWILGVGLRTEGWPEQRYPTARELDAVSGPLPVCLWSFDHHALVMNSSGMRAVGVTPSTPDPANGRIDRGPDAVPTGLMLEAAAKMVWTSIPEPGPKERRQQVMAALQDLVSHGFTEIHDLLTPPWLGPVLAELDAAGELPASILLYPRLEDVAAVHAGAGQWQRDRVRLAGAKLFADGTLNSRTAWMLDPYADPLPGLPRGQSMVTRVQVRDAVAMTRSLGLGLAVHAIGDAAVRCVLDGYQDSGVRRHPLLRIEHAEIIDEADVPRFAQLGVVCSVQPCHLLTDIEALHRGLPQRLGRVLPLRDLVAAGCRPGELLWFGSDVPIVRPHPHDSILAATARRREGMPAAGAIAPEQALSNEEAWRAFAM